jgi:hypothetical protein
MWLERRFKGVPQPVAIMSTLFFILSIIGVFTITSHFWRNVSLVVLGIAGLTLFYEFFFELPSKVYERDTKTLQSRINELLPLEQAAKYQKDNPAQFISARFESLMVEKGKLWVGSDVILTSRLPYAIEIKKVDVILWLPMNKGKHRYDMQTRIGEYLGSISGEAGQRDRSIRVHLDNDPELSTKLLDYIGEYPYEYLPSVEGTVIITTDELRKIELGIPESSVCIHILKEFHYEL